MNQVERPETQNIDIRYGFLREFRVAFHRAWVPKRPNNLKVSISRVIEELFK